jgi:hypothetical protein
MKDNVNHGNGVMDVPQVCVPHYHHVQVPVPISPHQMYLNHHTFPMYTGTYPYHMTSSAETVIWYGMVILCQRDVAHVLPAFYH